MLTKAASQKNHAFLGNIISRRKLLILGTAISIASPAAMTANVLPDPVLQTSPTLRAPVRSPPSETERSLLRLEAKAGQFGIDETALIDDMTSRLQRMARTIEELHTLIATTPSQPCAPAAIACPTASEALTNELNEFADLPWLPLAGGACVLALLGLLWRQRRRQVKINADATPAMTRRPLAPAASSARWPIATPSVTKPPPPPPAAKAVKRRTEMAASEPQVTKVKPPAAVPSSKETKAAAPLAIQSPQTQPASAPMPPDADDAVDDAELSLELADVMLSMGLAEGAAQTLSDHIRSHPRQALYHWLKLLDVYRRSGMKEEFDKSAQELQQHFNIAPPDWQAIDAANRISSLESYAHIINRTQELWPRHSCADYLNRLLDDNRGGTRTGFPQPVIEEILFLLAILRG